MHRHGRDLTCMDLGARAREARCSVHFGTCACTPCRVRRGEATALAIELRDQHTKPSLHKANSVGRSPARTLPAHRLCVRVRVCVNCGRVRACVREWRVCECETVAPHHAQKAQPRSSRAASSPRATSVSLSILITLAAPGAVEINTSTVARRYSSTCTALAGRLAHAEFGGRGEGSRGPGVAFSVVVR